MVIALVCSLAHAGCDACFQPRAFKLGAKQRVHETPTPKLHRNARGDGRGRLHRAAYPLCGNEVEARAYAIKPCRVSEKGRMWQVSTTGSATATTHTQQDVPALYGWQFVSAGPSTTPPTLPTELGWRTHMPPPQVHGNGGGACVSNGRGADSGWLGESSKTKRQ